jgi:hypothetical protein
MYGGLAGPYGGLAGVYVGLLGLYVGLMGLYGGVVGGGDKGRLACRETTRISVLHIRLKVLYATLHFTHSCALHVFDTRTDSN